MDRVSKWVATVASIWIQCSCGASYAFGIYSPILKSSQGYDQSTLETISVFKDIGANAGVLSGANAGVLSGVLYSVVISRPHGRATPSLLRGPWVVHFAGAIQCFAGYFFMWLAVTGAISRPDVPVMCLFMFLAAHAQTFFSTANVVTGVQNFPDFSGTVVGIMKGCLGLSGAILIQIYQTLFAGKPSNFLLMLAILPTSLSLALMFLVRFQHTQHSNSKDDKTHLNGFSLIAMIVATYLFFLIVLENVFPLSQCQRAFALAILLVLLASPIHIVLKARKNNITRLSHTFPTLNAPLINDSITKNCIDVHKARDNIIDVGEELNLVQAMCTLQFWLLFVAMLCGMGSGMATINNISQIGESLGYTVRERSTLVSLWSIWNFLGRFGAGYMSDVFLHQKGWARPLVMTLTLATMTAGHIIIGSGFPGNLYIGSVIVGVCYGSQWSLMPTISCEIFGVQHMGTIFNTIAVASPLGSYIFSVRVIGYIYDKERSEMGNSCSGTHCFMLSFFILACVSLFGFLVALALFVKTRGIYTRIIVRRQMGMKEIITTK